MILPPKNQAPLNSMYIWWDVLNRPYVFTSCLSGDTCQCTGWVLVQVIDWWSFWHLAITQAKANLSKITSHWVCHRTNVNKKWSWILYACMQEKAQDEIIISKYCHGLGPVLTLWVLAMQYIGELDNNWLMACHFSYTKLLPKPMITYCWSNFQKQNSIIIWQNTNFYLSKNAFQNVHKTVATSFQLQCVNMLCGLFHQRFSFRCPWFMTNYS